jgi:hypothetical protein
MKRQVALFVLTFLLCLGLTFWPYAQARTATAPPVAACATASFSLATNFGTGNGSLPFSVAVGDFNSDSKPDLVTANLLTNNVALLLGNGMGGFGAATSFSMGFLPDAVAAADVSGDGKLDIITADAGDNGGKVSVRLGDGMGGFGARTAFNLFGFGFNTVEPHDIVASDLNGDGKLDLVTANFESDNAAVLLNNCTAPCTTPSFANPVFYPTGLNSGSVAVGDVNADSKRDLVVTNHNSSNVSVLLGNGNGTFQTAVNFSPNGQPSAVALGDVNGDGKPDLLVANDNQDQIAVLLNTYTAPTFNTSSFGAATSFNAGDYPLAIDTGDFDGDGKLDVVTANLNSGNVTVLLGSGLGGFGTAKPFAVADAPRWVAARDFNGDGKLDLVTPTDADNVSVLLNNCQPNQAPTINGLGVTRTEGTAGSSAQIATAADNEDTENVLKLEISSDGTTFNSSATKNNVVVTLTDSDGNATGTNPDATGKVFADVVANCGAAPTLFTLRVTDSGGLTNTTTFIVSIIANPAPTLSYANQSVNYGNPLTVNASSASDNGSIASYSLKSVTPTVPPGTVTVNSGNGVVTVSDNVPAGTFTVVVTATDNCNLGTDASFMLTVNCVVDPVVTNLNESGAGSLRAAIAAACPNSTITFQNGLTGTITLTTGQLVIDKNLIVQGPGAQVVTVSGNHASRVFYVNTGVAATLDRLTIADGQAPVIGGSSRGGGVYNDAGDVTISNSVLSGNMVSGGTFGTGGGIFNFTGVLRIYNCTLTGNTASNNGGGLTNEYGMVIISHSTFSGNSINSASHAEGGGIWTRGTLTLTNSTLSGNMISGTGINRGGGLYIFAGHGVITHSTLTGNSVSGGTSNKGGGLENNGQFGEIGYTIKNTTIAGNSAATSGPDAQGALVSLGHNLIGKGEGSSGITHGVNNDQVGTLANPLDPLLGSLVNNGGPTETRRPQVGSPLLNAAGPVSEVQLVRVVGTGTFTLTFNGQTTSPLAANASAATVQAQLESLSSIGAGNVAVSVSTFPNSVYAMRFQGALAELNQPAFTGTASANTSLTIRTALDGGNVATDQRGFTRPQGSAPDIGAVETNYALAATGGTPQSTVVNTSFTSALQVTLTESGQPVSGEQIAFSGPGSGASVTFPNGNTASTDSQGRASVNVNANGVTGAFVVNASAPGLTASFNLTNLCATVTVTGVQPVMPTCIGGANGSLTINATGGTGALQYSINNGQTFQNSNVFTGLTAGSYQAVVRDANNCPSAAFPISLSQPTAIMFNVTASAPACFGGANGSLTINALGGTGALQYSINSGASFQQSNVFTGLGAGNYQVVVKDANGCPTLPQNVTLSQPAALSLSPAALSTGVAGQAFTQQFTPSGGTGLKSVSLQGALPNWLSFTPASATLSGTPPQPATVSFTLVLTDQANCTASFNYTLNFVCPALNLTPQSLPPASVNTAYPQTLTATPSGTTYSYAVTSGLLPPGLTLNSDGSFSGAPAQSGTFNFRVSVTGWGTCSSFRDYVLLVNCPAVTLNPATLPAGTAGTAYNQSVSASPAGSYTYSVTSGALPPGLTLHAATGALAGTPAAGGTFAFTLTAAAGGCAGSRSYSLTIVCVGVSFTPASLPGVIAGVPYQQSLSVSPAGTYTFSLQQGNLPPGLNLDAATGVISGLATAKGTYQFTVLAAVVNGCSGTQAYTLSVTCPTITVTPASLPNGTTGTAYSQSLSATPAGNYSFAKTSGGLPPGLTLSAAGSLSGNPTTQGTYTFTVTATGFGSCTGSRSYTLVITANCATITLPALPAAGTVNVNYSGNLAATTPSGSYTFSVESGSLPPGLTINNLFGQLSGKPAAAGVFTFTLKATRSNGCTGTREYTVVISSAQAALARVADYDGDGKSDLSLWSSANGRWQIVRSSDEQTTQTVWGAAGDLTLLGDYDGDGLSDLAVFRPGNGTWYVKQSSGGPALVKAWGAAADVPVPGDYDGDGQTDVAVWRPSEGKWYVLKSSDGGYEIKAWGLGAAPYLDVPVPGDYDGDGVTDLAVFRRSSGTWLIQCSADGQYTSKTWGVGSDVPVAGDYDGDGRSDLAVWRGATGEWFVLKSSDQSYEVKAWGAAAVGDVPVPGDYDGDGLADLAVWRAPEGRWYLWPGGSLNPQMKSLGRQGDVPVASSGLP